MKNSKPIPRFKNEDDEREFWAVADTSEYFDLDKAEKTVIPNLKPSTESVSLRLPVFLIARIKELANKKDIPYKSLMKMFLAEKVEQVLKSSR